MIFIKNLTINKILNMNAFRTTILLVLNITFSSSVLTAQYNLQIDTLPLFYLNSNNIPLFSTKDSLFAVLGIPEFIREKEITICDSMIGNKKSLSTMNVCLLYYNNKQIQYIEKDNKIRLRFVDFKINSSIEIYTPQICFKRNLKLKEMMEVFQFSKDNVYINKHFPPPWNYSTNKIERSYCIYFLTGEPCYIVIEIYFDKNQRLRYMNIEPYYF
jgi:hypothetical protein